MRAIYDFYVWISVLVWAVGEHAPFDMGTFQKNIVFEGIRNIILMFPISICFKKLKSLTFYYTKMTYSKILSCVEALYMKLRRIKIILFLNKTLD